MPAKHVVCENYVSRVDPPAFYLFMGWSDQVVPIPVDAGVSVSFRDDNGWTALTLQWTDAPPVGLSQSHLQALVREAAQFWVMHTTLRPAAKSPVPRPQP